ncbi:MAG TPA: sodium:solute symporter family protein [Candidatus Acidoferrum sp.]|nr:sodium:solute symporter family protein [Candidatus Acidoferrum sp.]
MHLHGIDIAVVVAYLAGSVLVGYWVSHRASRDMRAYFLGGNVLPWYVLGISNASGMFDISGTMLLVYWMFVYGVKSVWIPWLWPTFNQIFLMVYLSTWLRRSNVMTGAEWIETRFGRGRGAQLAHVIVVIYAFISIVGFFTYGFKGIGKFAATFLPWQLSVNQYALVLIAITAVYVIKGGMFSVVITEVMQFCILSVASFAVGIIAMMKVAPGILEHFVPSGWENVFFGWHLDLDWSNLVPSANARVAQDGYGLFGFFIMMLLFKGILLSAAGPAPNYDMQRVLSSKNPREASMMSGWVNVVLTFPRYFLITGLTVLALVFFSEQIRRMGTDMDFERILPLALAMFVPSGLLGVLIAGLLAAYMSNFAATVNAAPPYFVNDIYKRFINPNASAKTYVRLSYLSSFAVVVLGVLIGWYVTSVNNVVIWIVTALWGGYTASNVLKWYWWRFNGYGYFWGMVAGISSALTVPAAVARITPLQNFARTHSLNLDVSVSFGVVFLLSLLGCFLGTLLTAPEDEEVLKDFYRSVRPWGFWGPILEKVRREDPSFRPNKDFLRDMFNILVGMIWQVALVALPIYIVTWRLRNATITVLLIAVTSLVLKYAWYDHLKELEQHIDQYKGPPNAVREPHPAGKG